MIDVVSTCAYVTKLPKEAVCMRGHSRGFPGVVFLETNNDGSNHGLIRFQEQRTMPHDMWATQCKASYTFTVRYRYH